MRTNARRLQSAISCVCVIACVSSLCGCKGQRDSYTERMQQTLADPVGQVFVHEQFGLSIRPPKPAGQVAAPEGFLGLFRGGDPPLAVAIAGSSGSESLEEFKDSAIERLNAAGLGPGGNPPKQDDMEYGDKVFELYSVRGQRQVGERKVLYYWYIYLTEAGPHKVMVAFLFPHDKYEEYSAAMASSLETLKIGEAGAGS